MDASIVGRHSDLLNSIDVDGRLNGTKLGTNTVVVSTDSAEAQELIGTQYMNLHRMPENLQKVQLVGDPLSTDLLNHQVVELTQANEFVPGPVGNQYYDDDLLPHDLTEEDKRLAAALVAVQLVQQQKQQHTSILASELLNAKSMSPLSPLPNVTIDKPGMAAMVTSYIQAFDDESATQQQLLDAQNHDRMLKMYQTQPPTPQLPEIRLPPLPPLKKVLSNQTLMRTRYNERNLLESTPVSDSNRISLTSPPEDIHVKTSFNKIGKNGEAVVDHLQTEETEGDSDMEGENDLKSSRKSLPHKKRIPRKLKTQPNRSMHSKGINSLPASKRSVYSCEICGASCVNQAKFFEHLKAHYEPNMLETASVSYENKEDSGQNAESEKSVAEDESGISCALCDRHFKRQKALETHMAVAHPQIEEFSEPEDLMEGIRHVVNIQTEAAEEDKMRSWRYNDDFPSDMCSSETDKTGDAADNSDFPDEDKGKKKKRVVHCPHCSRTFTHRSSLLYHVRSYSGHRLHQCDVCGKGFFAANALRVHMRMHSGVKPYKCEVCGRNFRQWGDLKYHMTSLHSNTKQFQCEFCGKDFARKYSLIIHRRIHTGEKNYVCEFCRKTFRASSYLVNHRRIHTGEKPYNCDVCHKPFRVKSDMKRHRNIHNKVSGGNAASRNTETTASATSDPDPLDLNARSTDEFRQPTDPNTLYVWLPASTEETIEESILPD